MTPTSAPIRPHRVLSLIAAALGLLGSGNARADPAFPADQRARVSVTRPLKVTGVTARLTVDDLIGIARTQFQGLIAKELGSAGYLLAALNDEPGAPAEQQQPLTLTGTLIEERCVFELIPQQCRIAMQWELEDPYGVVVYRVVTRAVQEGHSPTELQRGLVLGALDSLLGRRRFPLQLVGIDLK